MFGLSYSEFVQGSALRTWNCVSHFASLLWYKFNHLRDPIMPRSRRRHHSRSKSRSRSHSHDRDREPKRRKIESYDSPHHKRSVSSQPEAIDSKTDDNEQINEKIVDISSEQTSTDESKDNEKNCREKSLNFVPASSVESGSSEEEIDKKKEKSTKDVEEIEDESEDVDSEDQDEKEAPETKNNKDTSNTPNKLKDKNNDLKITPTKVLSPKQLQKRVESEKKRQEKQREKEEKEQKRQEELRKKLEEKKRLTEEKLRLKQEKDEQRIKEKQAKDEKKKKEQEEKDKKRREKEEKDEQKKREREQEKLKKQQEIEEKNKEKQKLEEQKQKTAAAFANFFLSKRNVEERKPGEISTFMPFEVKSDMRLAPIIRSQLKNSSEFDEMLKNQNCDKLYLNDLKEGKEIGKSGKTWAFEDADQDDDVVIIEDNIGERIEEQKPKPEKMRAKLLKFHENQRPPYFGTFKKKSKTVGPRKPFGKDNIFNYEIDSDEEWEEEGEGESLKGTDDEDEKDNESENEYEVDNEVFVPHAYLSDDECDDESNSKLSPESHKAKLKLLKNEFDEEMKSKTKKIKPRVIGCIWYDKNNGNVEEAIDRCLQPFSIICNGQIEIKKRSEFATSVKKVAKLLSKEHIPIFLKYIHGSVDKRINIVKSFIEYMSNNGVQLEMSKISLGKQLKSFAHWKKCPEEGAMHNKLCWYVGEDIRKEYNVDLSLPNKLSVKRAQTK